MYQRLVFNFLILAELNDIHCAGFCAISLKSMEVVSSCPLNKTEMEKSAMRKNCPQYINEDAKRNCREYKMIKYHCVINDSGNQTIEVCAPERTIHGFCAAFSEEGAKVYGHFYLECMGNDYYPRCPSHYLSSSTYEYKDCYNLTNNVKIIEDVEIKIQDEENKNLDLKYSAVNIITKDSYPRNNVTERTTITTKETYHSNPVTERSIITSKGTYPRNPVTERTIITTRGTYPRNPVTERTIITTRGTYHRNPVTERTNIATKGTYPKNYATERTFNFNFSFSTDWAVTIVCSCIILITIAGLYALVCFFRKKNIQSSATPNDRPNTTNAE